MDNRLTDKQLCKLQNLRRRDPLIYVGALRLAGIKDSDIPLFHLTIIQADNVLAQRREAVKRLNKMEMLSIFMKHSYVFPKGETAW